MRVVILVGVVALVAGMLLGVSTVSGGEAPTPTAMAGRIETVSIVPPSANAFLAAAIPSPVWTTGPTPTSAPTATPLPATDTPVLASVTPTRAAPTNTGASAPPQVNAWSVAVIDEESGALLYSRDPHRRMAPASLTKIFTALVALKHGDLGQNIKVQFDQAELVDSTLMGIKPGDTYTLEDLLYGLMLPSGNDSALAIANVIGGSESHFAVMMNSQAADLGLTDSHFVNPHGLDSPTHYSSAFDLAMAARYGMTHYEEFRSLAKARTWEVHGTNDYWLFNLNRFLRSYNGSDGVKIGYTDNAGRAIVASATRNGHRVYVALLHCGDIVSDSVPLFNWVFANYTWPTT